MPNPYFQFKQFVVFHDKCAMKVGTDGVLVGAWAQVDGARKVLDIGTGSGLIALMLAQRNPDAFVTAVDIDEAAVEQARENVARTPWSDRMEVERLDIRKAPEEWNGCFDAIVSNPPYFVESVKCLRHREIRPGIPMNWTFTLCYRKSRFCCPKKVVFRWYFRLRHRPILWL